MQIFLHRKGSHLTYAIDTNRFLMYEAVIGSFNDHYPNSAALIHVTNLEYIDKHLYIVPLWKEIHINDAFSQADGDPTILFADEDRLSYVGLRSYLALRAIVTVLNADVICGDFGLGFKYILKANL